MFEFDLFSNADTLSSISEQCNVKLSKTVSIPGLKLCITPLFELGMLLVQNGLNEVLLL